MYAPGYGGVGSAGDGRCEGLGVAEDYGAGWRIDRHLNEGWWCSIDDAPATALRATVQNGKGSEHGECADEFFCALQQAGVGCGCSRGRQRERSHALRNAGEGPAKEKRRDKEGQSCLWPDNYLIICRLRSAKCSLRLLRSLQVAANSQQFSSELERSSLVVAPGRESPSHFHAPRSAHLNHPLVGNPWPQ